MSCLLRQGWFGHREKRLQKFFSLIPSTPLPIINVHLLLLWVNSIFTSTGYASIRHFASSLVSKWIVVFWFSVYFPCCLTVGIHDTGLRSLWHLPFKSKLRSSILQLRLTWTWDLAFPLVECSFSCLKLKMHYFICTSRIGSRVNRNGPVCVCSWVCWWSM